MSDLAVKRFIQIIQAGALYSTYLLLTGCAGGGASLPTNIPDGQNTHRYQTSFSAFEYTGQWRGSSPNGQGAGRDYDATGKLIATCKGEWVSPYPSVITGKGDIYRPNDTLLFHGDLIGSLVMGSGCMAGSSGMYTSQAGWTVQSDKFAMVSFVSGVSLLAGAACTLGDPKGNTWKGICNLPPHSKYANIQYDGYRYNLPELQAYPEVINFTAAGIANFTLANGPGVMTSVTGEKIEGTFDLGHLEDGQVKVTSTDGKVSVAQARDGKIVSSAPTTSQVARGDKSCGFDGWHLASGQCEDNTWSGAVEAYDASGVQKITGNFVKGIPQGDITWSRSDSKLQVSGPMTINDGSLSFTRAKVSIGGVLAYEGDMSGFAPNGDGVCVVDRKREHCEYSNGERVDALYKTRVENENLRRELAVSRKQNGKNQAQPVPPGTATNDPLNEPGSGSSTSVSLASIADTIRSQMITGMAKSPVSGRTPGGTVSTKSNVPPQNTQTATSSLQGASMGTRSGLKGSAAVSSSASADALNDSLKNMAGMGAANNDSHAERSKQLDDIVQNLAADSGMKTRTMTYRCSPDDPETSVSVPYKSESCAAAKQNWFSVYACNDIEHMSAANQQCLEACGNAGCDER